MGHETLRRHKIKYNNKHKKSLTGIGDIQQKFRHFFLCSFIYFFSVQVKLKVFFLILFYLLAVKKSRKLLDRIVGDRDRE